MASAAAVGFLFIAIIISAEGFSGISPRIHHVSEWGSRPRAAVSSLVDIPTTCVLSQGNVEFPKIRTPLEVTTIFCISVDRANSATVLAVLAVVGRTCFVEVFNYYLVDIPLLSVSPVHLPQDRPADVIPCLVSRVAFLSTTCNPRLWLIELFLAVGSIDGDVLCCCARSQWMERAPTKTMTMTST